MGRPKFEPTEQDRAAVKLLAAVGTPHESIAKKIGIRSPKTLRRHFRDELDLAAIEANANVGGALYNSAVGGNTEAQKFWLTHRAPGWGKSGHRDRFAPAPFVVALEEERQVEERTDRAEKQEEVTS